MRQSFRLIASMIVAVVGCRAAAQAPAGDAPPPAAPEWTSTSRAKVAAPLPASGPMAGDLSAKDAPPKWSDVPLPPPPALKPAASAGAAAPVAAPAPGGAAVGAKLAAPAEGTAAGPAAPEGAPGAGEPSKEPKVKFGADQTGAMVSVTQDLESDKIRQQWAATGGAIPAFDANLGMTMLYKNMSQTAGAGAYMSGIGFDFGGGITLLNLTPPKYETRDRNWLAFKVGAAMDMGLLALTIYTGYGDPMSATMSSINLTGVVGFMYAFGSFDSPSDWSGMAVGAEWAPSYQSQTTTMQLKTPYGTYTQTSSASNFNASGFALNFESGSLQQMAGKMGKKARMKVRLFILPPVGDMPFLMTASLGAVWY